MVRIMAAIQNTDDADIADYHGYDILVSYAGGRRSLLERSVRSPSGTLL